MTIAPRLLGLVLVAMLGCTPRASSPSFDDTSDAGELSCDERLQAQSVCLRAMDTRCGSQQADCESTCDSRRALSGSTNKHPTERDELDAPRCRETCRVNRDSCIRSSRAQCPIPCQDNSPGAPPAPASSTPPAPTEPAVPPPPTTTL